jgi:hypothetical protein
MHAKSCLQHLVAIEAIDVSAETPELWTLQVISFLYVKDDSHVTPLLFDVHFDTW